MATQYITLRGKCMWAKVFEETRDLTGYNDQALATDGQLTIDMILEENEYDKLKHVGSKKYRPMDHKQPDGTYKVRFVRPWSSPHGFGDGAIPVCYMGEEIDYTTGIGNGSEVSVDLEVYDIKRFKGVKGTRLIAVDIHDLVPFTPTETSPPEDDDEEIPF